VPWVVFVGEPTTTFSFWTSATGIPLPGTNRASRHGRQPEESPEGPRPHRSRHRRRHLRLPSLLPGQQERRALRRRTGGQRCGDHDRTERATGSPTPLFKDFAETWYLEKEVEWRKSHRITVRRELDSLISRFGEKAVGQITKADVLAYRAELGKVTARGKETKLSAARINKMLNPLRQILNEAADRFNFPTPCQNIKQLRIKRTDVDPFSLEDVKSILATVREDFRDYFTVRFFTGMRTGEVDGLKWKYIDFERRLIWSARRWSSATRYTKTDGSQRDIQMSQLVFEALKRQHAATGKHSDFVFCNRLHKPLDHKNVTNRVWYPLLRHLGLKKRRPYQCRHTAATLWLAAGEAPEWIARQLGHTTTEMLFRVYSRYVPNLTRRDGSAFERLITQSIASQALPVETLKENCDV
jgi:integrase